MVKRSAKNKSKIRFSNFFTDSAIIFGDKIAKSFLKPLFNLWGAEKLVKNDPMNILIFFSHYKFDIKRNSSEILGSRGSEYPSNAYTSLKGDVRKS